MSEEGAGLVINMDLDNIKPDVLEAPGEHKMRVEAAEQVTSKNGNLYLNLRMSFVDNDDAEQVYRIMMIPDDQDADEKKVKRWKKDFIAFFAAFDIEFSGSLDLDSVVGQEGWCIIGLENDEEYGDRNTVKKFVKGH